MLIENNGVKYYSSSAVSNIDLASGANVKHAFFTRIGGTSQPPFESLNTDPFGGDDTIAVSNNLLKIADIMGVDFSRLVGVKQVHGNEVYKVEAGAMSARNMKADAIITEATDVAISIKTADCVPILLIDPANNAIGAIHAGWRSTVQNIVSKTLSAMTESYGTDPSKLVALIGPHIKPCCFTVSSEVTEEFKNAFPNNNSIIEDDSIDLGRANLQQLLDSGVQESNITTEGGCTHCNEEEFFSHRRDGSGDTSTGRQISIILISNNKE